MNNFYDQYKICKNFNIIKYVKHFTIQNQGLKKDVKKLIYIIKNAKEAQYKILRANSSQQKINQLEKRLQL